MFREARKAQEILGDPGGSRRFQEAREVWETREVLGGQGGPGGSRGKLHVIMAVFEKFCPKNI